LNALEGAIKRACQGVRQGGFAHAGNVFYEEVTAGNQRDDGKPNRFWLPFDYGFDGTLEPLNELYGFGNFGLGIINTFESSHWHLPWSLRRSSFYMLKLPRQCPMSKVQFQLTPKALANVSPGLFQPWEKGSEKQ
jgi:hypothetical protein